MKNELSSYASWLAEAKSAYQKAQVKAAVAVNSALLHFYYLVGREISLRNYESEYRSAFFKKLSIDLRKEMPDASGFSVSNLRYMKWFYQRYCGFLSSGQADFEFSEIAQQPAVQSEKGHFAMENAQQVAVELFSVPWGHLAVVVHRDVARSS